MYLDHEHHKQALDQEHQNRVLLLPPLLLLVIGLNNCSIKIRIHYLIKGRNIYVFLGYPIVA